MDKIELRELEKQIDKYFDNLTEEQFMENMVKEGLNIDKELEKDTILDELENGNNVVIPIRKKRKPRPSNKKFNNQSMRRRH